MYAGVAGHGNLADISRHHTPLYGKNGLAADDAFPYFSRRAGQIVRAINAPSPAAATSHRHLSLLHTARAAAALERGHLHCRYASKEAIAVIVRPIRPICVTEAPALLIVDDDREIRMLLSQALIGHGYRVGVASNTREMDEALAKQPIDLILLDVMMPGEDGVSACQRITRDGGPAVIFLSGLGGERDRIAGLEAGAGHYLPKPCSPREIVSTVRAALRVRQLAKPAERQRYLFEGWQMDVGVYELLDADGVLIALTDGEFALLRALVERPLRILTRKALLNAARGLDSDSFDRAIDVQISRLRRKMRASGDEIIRTIRNEGYMFVPNVIRA